MNMPIIICPWCGKVCLNIDLDPWELEDGYEDEVFCEHCGGQFNMIVHVDIDIETERIIPLEPGDKVNIDSGRLSSKTGCVILKDEDRGEYLVFMDQTRKQDWFKPKRVTRAPGIWSHPDQLWIPFNTNIINGGASCPKPV
jgi:hypothetical protein